MSQQEDPLDARIRQACAEFEQQLITAQSPKIEDFLTTWSGSERSSLFRELLRIEADLLQKSNHHVDKSAYLRRFPDLVDVVDDLSELDAEPLTVSVHESHKDTVLWSPANKALSGAADGADNIRFRILRPHAKGGLGQVSLALDEELCREVALKEIQPQLADDAHCQSRFLLEAEITGRLEHPGIVPVYGLGRFNDGRPFYAMRFIKGDSLQQAIGKFHSVSQDNQSPTFRSVEFRKLLGRFVDVCQTIEYAHSRGVLHRDLKPANIMLGNYGETLVVDWGLAKVDAEGTDALDTSETRLKPNLAGSIETAMGSVFGTPGYMSPEQAEGKLDELAEVSDVFSLGATLYYMLTSQSPRDVLEPPRAIHSDIPKPLVSICLKAMAQSPADRYGSAAEVGEEIERWLADEPVQAHRDPLQVRLRRWIRRHQKLATGTAATFLVGALSLVVGVSLVTAKNQELTLANQRSRERFDLALKAIEKYHTGVSEDVLLKRPDLANLRKKLLRSALEFYRELEPTLTGSADSASRYNLARAYNSIAMITSSVEDPQQGMIAQQRSVEVFERLASDHPQDLNYSQGLVTSYGNLARAQHLTGSSKAAQETLELALNMQKIIAVEHATNSKVQDVLAQIYINLGNLQAELGETRLALKSLEFGLGIQRKLISANPKDARYNRMAAAAFSSIGTLQEREGDYKAAVQTFEQALVVQGKLVDTYPRVGEYRSALADMHMELGVVLTKMGQHSTALKSFDVALRVYEELADVYPTVTEFQSGIARVCGEIGRTQLIMRDVPAARTSYARVLGILEKLAFKNPAVPHHRRDLATSHFALSFLHRQTGAKQKAIESIRKVVDLRQKLLLDEPAVIVYQSDTARAVSLLGSMLLEEAKTRKEGMELINQAMKVQAKLVLENPANRGYQSDLATTQHFLAEGQLRMRDLSSALASFQQARKAFERLVEADPVNPGYQNQLAEAFTELGLVKKRTGDPVGAEKCLGEALEIRQKLGKAFPTILDYQDGLAESFSNLGQVQSKSQGLKSHQRAVEIRRNITKRDQTVTSYQVGLAASLLNLGKSQAELGNGREALQYFQSSRKITQELVTRHPNVAQYQVRLASSHFNLALLAQSSKPEAAVKLYQESLRLLQKLVAKGSTSTKQDVLLAKSYNNLALLRMNTSKATEYLRRALELRKKLSAENPRNPEHPIELGGICCNLGIALQKSDTAKSLDWYAQAINTLQSVTVNGRHPHSAVRRNFLVKSHLGRALLLESLKRHSQAITHWAAAAELAPQGPFRQRLRVSLCYSRAFAGDFREAVAELKEITDERIPVPLLYTVASAYSLAAGAVLRDATIPPAKRKELSEEYASRAVAVLNKARKLGYFSKSTTIQIMKKDSDIDPLRSRQDYKKLLRQLESVKKSD